MRKTRKKNKPGRTDYLLLIGAIAVIAAVLWMFGPAKKPAKKYIIRKAGQAVPVKKPAVTPGTKKAPAPGPATIVKGELAIVIDDCGYTRNNLQALYAIKPPVSLAVLPGLPHSADIAREAAARGNEVMLHLPLESVGNITPEKATIYTSMSSLKVKNAVGQAIAAVPGAKGANNHQGSKATADNDTMLAVFTELKKRNLFFLDSVTTGESVCGVLAASMGLRYAERDIFLDIPPGKLSEQETKSYVKKRLFEAADIAKKRGRAIAIGHDRRITLEVLRENVPKLAQNGIKVVPVSKLAE